MRFLEYFNQKGATMLEVSTSLAAIILVSLLVVPGYKSVKNDMERQMHLVNSLSCIQMAQNGLLEGWIIKPSIGKSFFVTVDMISSRDEVISVIDPSTNLSYSADSGVQIYNNNGALEWYVRLKSSEDNHAYIDDVMGVDIKGNKRAKDIKKGDVFLKY